MKQKILSIILAFAMCVILLSDESKAAGNKIIGKENPESETAQFDMISTTEADDVQNVISDIQDEKTVWLEMQQAEEEDVKPLSTTLGLAELRNKFPAGKYWNHADNPGAGSSQNNQDGYTSTPCSKHGGYIGTSEQTCNGFAPGSTQLSWQCMGYAEKLGYDSTGFNPRLNANGWYTYTSSSALDSLKAGDIVRYKNNGHSIFVTAVNGDTVTYTDCNSDNHCIIRWDATISKATLRSTFSYVRSAPKELTSSTPTLTVDTRYPTPFKCRTISSSNVQLYTSVNGATGGHAYPTDECVIEEIYTNGWLKVSVPWSDGSTQVRYCQTNQFIGQAGDHNLWQITAVQKVYGYHRPDGAEQYGWIDPGDSITIVAETENMIQIVYPVNSGKRCGWFYRSDIVFPPNGSILSVQAGTSVTDTVFTWTSADRADYYNVRIYQGETWTGTDCTVWGEYGNSCSVRLPAGHYEAYIDAVNGAGVCMGNVVAFDVSMSAIPGISEETIPGTLSQGAEFEVYGVISSGQALTSVTVGCYDASGIMRIGKTVSPNANSFNLHTISNEIIFSDLPGGIYAYRVKASTSEGETILIDKTFIVLGNSRTIDDGTYRLFSSQDGSYGITIADNSNDAGANVILDTIEGNTYCYFRFEYISDGYYKITNEQSEKVLDVNNASNESGANVKQWLDNGQDAQRWQVLPTFTGEYYLVPKCATTCCLDLEWGRIQAGQNIQIYTANMTSAQKWKLEEEIPVSNYVITYNANGGTDAPSGQTVQGGTLVTLSYGIPKRIGYNFIGWSTSSTATTGTYQPGESIILNADMTLYAVWEKEAELPFTDVNQSSWYYATVKEAYELGLMTGTTSTTFAPNSPMTRAMATAVLYRISGSPAIEYESIFSDVADGKYYSKCVTWAAKNKIVNGYAADNTFRPNANVTREQMAVILYNYAKFRGLDVSVQADLSSFNDVGQISSYARTAMSWAVENKLMSGTLEGNLNPKNEATRAECAKMLLQTYKLIEGNS